MEWTNSIPEKEGLYLRVNPALVNYTPCIENAHEIEGEMCVGPRGGLNMTRLSKWEGAKHMLWYGPINPPKSETKDRPDSGKERQPTGTQQTHEAIALVCEMKACPTYEKLTQWYHDNLERINAVVAQQHHA